MTTAYLPLHDYEFQMLVLCGLHRYHRNIIMHNNAVISINVYNNNESPVHRVYDV